MSECLIIMAKDATKEQIVHVIEAVRSDNGKVQQRYPPRIIIARDGQDIGKRIIDLRLNGISGIYIPGELALDKVDTLGLSKKDSSVIKAWIIRNSNEYEDRKAARAATRISEKLSLPDSEDVATPTGVVRLSSPAMTGTAVVALIVVDGPAGTDAEIDDGKKDIVNTEVQSGTMQLKDLASTYSTTLEFIIDVQVVNLSDDPANVTSEQDWRDKAMAQIDTGYLSGDQGINDYLQALTTRYGAKWASIAFFTKYKANDFAYRPIGKDYCVIRYPEPGHDGKYMDSRGWTPDDLDMVFAHETGHICGAGHVNTLCLMGSSAMDWQISQETATAFQWI